MHFLQPLDGTKRLRDGHQPIAELICSSQSIFDFVVDLARGRSPSAVFYTQVAYRTPAKPSTPPLRPTSYHLDGEANAIGSRFPDHFSIIVGVALSPQLVVGMGNFSATQHLESYAFSVVHAAVFPGAHLQDWTMYANSKMCHANLSPVLRRLIQLRADDARSRT